MARLSVMRLLLALSLAPMTSQGSAQTEAEGEARTELRQTLPALEREEQAREDLQRDEQARKSDGLVLRGGCHDC